jgi:hypothetical protein
MTRPISLVSTVLFLALPAAAQFSAQETAAAAKDPRAYTLDETSIEIAKLEAVDSPSESAPSIAGAVDAVVLDSIINAGQKIWKIIDDNRPVVDIKTQSASALPEGVGNWRLMQGWKAPQGTIYRLTAKNAYGLKVVNLRYQVLRTTGGSYEGVGKYLTAVSIEPLLVEVAWGYRFSLDASVPDSGIVNVGTSEAPVAALLAQVAWRIATPVKDSRGKGIYYMQGDGVYQELGGPFKRGGAMKASAIAKAAGETLSYEP